MVGDRPGRAGFNSASRSRVSRLPFCRRRDGLPVGYSRTRFSRAPLFAPRHRQRPASADAQRPRPWMPPVSGQCVTGAEAARDPSSTVGERRSGRHVHTGTQSTVCVEPLGLVTSVTPAHAWPRPGGGNAPRAHAWPRTWGRSAPPAHQMALSGVGEGRLRSRSSESNGMQRSIRGGCNRMKPTRRGAARWPGVPSPTSPAPRASRCRRSAGRRRPSPTGRRG